MTSPFVIVALRRGVGVGLDVEAATRAVSWTWGAGEARSSSEELRRSRSLMS
jgi:hypothetical protein